MEEEKKNNEDIAAQAEENTSPETDNTASDDAAENIENIELDSEASDEAEENSDNSGIDDNTGNTGEPDYPEEAAEDITEDNTNPDYSFDSDEDDFSEGDDDNVNPDLPSDEVDEPSDVVDEERLKRKAARKEKLRRMKKPFIIVICILAAAFVALMSFCLVRIPKDRVMNNVYIDTLDVSGLTYEETVAAINASYMFKDTQITLLNGDKTFSMSSSDIGMLALPEESAQRAVNYCKNGNFVTNSFNSLKLLFSKHVIMPAAQVDTEKLDAKINEFGNMVLGERKNFTVEIGDNNTATVHTGQTGYNMQPDTARGEITSAFDREQFSNIPVTFESAPPEAMTVEAFDLLVYKDPVDARYEINGNSVEILPEENGRYINKEEAAALLQNVYEGCEPVSIPFYTSEASVKEQTLRDKLFANTLSSYSTSYGGSTSNRCANISRAASLINGTVVAPGGVFSFNDTVGHRTTANGFYTAKEYVNGESVDGIGGGTCQVSSTLYSAVLYADMSIVERLNHMMTVGYIPLGQDATVSDGGVDFKFKNSSDYPIKISAYTSGATITISIIGTNWEPKREVKISNSQGTSGANTVVHSTRYVYANGELISTDTLNSSTYMPHKSQ